MIILLIIMGVGVFITIVSAISALIGVPFLPTHMKQARVMMELAEIKPGMKVVDLGSGAGRLLFLAAARGANTVGYELNPFLVVWTKLMARVKRLPLVAVKCQSLYDADLKDVDVVFAFLFPGPMKKLSAKLFSELKPGAKVVSYTFLIPDKQPLVKKEGIFVYQV